MRVCDFLFCQPEISAVEMFILNCTKPTRVLPEASSLTLPLFLVTLLSISSLSFSFLVPALQKQKLYEQGTKNDHEIAQMMPHVRLSDGKARELHPSAQR
jgi:hypothetical protein